MLTEHEDQETAANTSSVREPAGSFPVRQSLAPEAFKAHELELTPECIAHNLTAEAACFSAGSAQLRWQWRSSDQAWPNH